MAAQGGKGSVRKLKQIIVKTSLNSPYALQWSPLDRTDMHFILEALEDVIKQLGLKKIEFRKKKKPSTSKKEDKEQLQGGSSKPPEQNETEDTRAHGWTDLNIRGQLAIGINEVTRALEKNELLLVLVCKSAKPTMITSHLIPLSASRGVPACQVPRLSERLAPVLGLTSVLALGFKQSADAFAEVAKAIIPRIPSLDVPWIQHGNEQPPVSEEIQPMDLQATELAQSEPGKCTSSHNQKRTVSSRLLSPTTTLQALKVKKIVPNPNKRRKLPKTKKRISK
ncbi:ribonuclease P protein subunit p38 [Sphaerodactylus townsendi]|uniref:ribonuclease P protein subunit p38 n=1 Tax=Sphaerodactylus townsendi TaxID=933632 RepID=UPI002026B2C2|nr:ribonuclease P protein subunit p38 [Sphaerodactylus townsendi]XP_048366800.1 ribonuclease P protein subunit p38 [Sphaerodactylus townsendi]XP_048366801.1 ribonuclease P protein subunit p38 [Sphaerodactylus townsendi]XP_048366802.1 ribonuclease P protein subunit p38 [Sphaerodactylus townsendi]